MTPEESKELTRLRYLVDCHERTISRMQSKLTAQKHDLHRHMGDRQLVEILREIVYNGMTKPLPSISYPTTGELYYWRTLPKTVLELRDRCAVLEALVACKESK